MGNSTSRINRDYLRAVGAPPMMAIKRSKQADYSRVEGNFGPLVSHAAPIWRAKPPFYGIWSVEYPVEGEIFPMARCRQICSYDPETNSLVIGYGIDALGNFLNDCWMLNLARYKWRRVATLRAARIQARSLLRGRELMIFGGKAVDGTYLADLHSVNLDTGRVTVYPFSKEPRGRENGLLFMNDECVFVWTGVGGRAKGRSKFIVLSFRNPGT
jgi:hypothetical protein